MISLYHHIWFWLERIEDCVRLAEKVDDPALCVSFCGYHWFAVENAGLEERVRRAARWLARANLCGGRDAPAGRPFAGCLPKTIEPAGEGDFPLAEFAWALREVGYAGPVGFQGYGMEGDPAENLARSLAAWRRVAGD